MAKKFSELRAKMPREAQAQAASLAKKYLAELPLDELRVARNLSQENLAQVLGVKQNAVSKLERRTDMYVSSLRNVIRAMGGDLRIEAVFPDGVVLIDQFKHVGKRVPAPQAINSRLSRRRTRPAARTGPAAPPHKAQLSRPVGRTHAPKASRRIRSDARAES